MVGGQEQRSAVVAAVVDQSAGTDVVATTGLVQHVGDGVAHVAEAQAARLEQHKRVVEEIRRLADAGCPVILMHHKGDPETMQDDPRYDRPVPLEIYDWLEARIAAAEAAGIARERILVDPGFGFGKTVQHNLALMNGLAMLHGLGCPVMVGASRKRTIGALSNEAPADRRLAGSLAFALKAAEQGAQLIRVHDVPETVQALKIWRGLRDQALTPRS